MNKKIILAVVAIIIVAGAVYFLKMNPKVTEPEPIDNNEITTEEVQNDLDSIDTGDIETELQDIDKELQGL